MEATITAIPAPDALIPAADRAREFIHAAKAPATLRAYRSDWRDFETWSSVHRLAALPAAPETVTLYLAERAETLKPASLSRRLAAISKAHSAAGYDSPASMRHAVVAEVLHGIRRTKGTAQACKAPLLVGQLKTALRDGREDLLGLRDRALLLIGFSGAFRRSELVGLQCRTSSSPTMAPLSPCGGQKRTRRAKGARLVYRSVRGREPAPFAR